MTFFKNVSAPLMIHGVVISADFGTSIANKINVAQSAKYHNIEDSGNKKTEIITMKTVDLDFLHSLRTSILTGVGGRDLKTNI